MPETREATRSGRIFWISGSGFLMCRSKKKMKAKRPAVKITNMNVFRGFMVFGKTDPGGGPRGGNQPAPRHQRTKRYRDDFSCAASAKKMTGQWRLRSQTSPPRTRMEPGIPARKIHSTLAIC